MVLRCARFARESSAIIVHHFLPLSASHLKVLIHLIVLPWHFGAQVIAL